MFVLTDKRTTVWWRRVGSY